MPASSRAARFGDGVFETVPVQEGLPYLWEYHEERLRAGLAALRIPAPELALRPEALRLIIINDVQDGLLRIAVSRGGESRGYLPLHDAPALVIIETLPPRMRQQGPITLWHSTLRRVSPGALPTHCKLAQGVGSTLSRLEAMDKGCDEALQCDDHGHLAEASGANLFWVKSGTLYTPSLATGALAGVTRRRVMELSPYPVVEGRYPPAALHDAETVFLTNAGLGLSAVGELRPQGWRWPSDGLAPFAALYRHDKAKYIQAMREALATTR